MVARGISGHLTAQGLHDRVMHAALTSRAFIAQECFHLVEQRPWSLGQGNIEANLQALREEVEQPAEPTTFKIWTLLQKGTTLMSELVAGVKLLMECPWSTNTTEQQHASVTLIKRMHPDYSLHLVLLRAGVHALGRLCPGPDVDKRLVLKLEAQLEKVVAKQQNE
eukprot:2779684-Lingulodinium_polyedra.AAC.1